MCPEGPEEQGEREGRGDPRSRHFVPPLLRDAEQLSQGAEAVVFRGLFEGGEPCVAKHRFGKAYRHPAIDRHALEHRTRSEARILASALRQGAPVPRLLLEDPATYTLYLERVPGPTVTEAITRHAALRSAPIAALLARDIGRSVALLHRAGVVHNDLTMSNIVLTCPYAELVRLSGGPETPPEGEGGAPAEGGESAAEPHPQPPPPLTRIIDFGLSSTGRASYETRAVDLYVLEKSLLALCGEEGLFQGVLEAYRGVFRDAGPAEAAAAEQTLRRLQTVRARGRKK